MSDAAAAGTVAAADSAQAADRVRSVSTTVVTAPSQAKHSASSVEIGLPLSKIA